MNKWVRIGLMASIAAFLLVMVVEPASAPPQHKAVVSMTTAENNCASFVRQVNTLNYHHPQLSYSRLARVAVPGWAAALSTAPHMTTAQVARHMMVTPKVTVSTGANDLIIVSMTATVPMVGTISSTWGCYTTNGKVSNLRRLM